MTKLIENIPPEVTEAVTESLRLFRQAQFSNRSDRQEVSQSLPSLLERSEQYIGEDGQPRKEHVRLIHHFACTGGTLITKCLACSPNLHALSEVDPLSTIPSIVGRFAPSDLVQLTEFSNRALSLEEKLDLFLGGLKVLHRTNQSKGLRTFIRDHAHSHFCIGPEIPERPTVREIVHRHFPVLSIVTVRHPIDSWLSLTANHWHEFQPPTVDEYARRYEVFLDEYSEVRIFRYEDFLKRPDEELSAMCGALDLTFPNDFQSLFMVHSFSGDSGRSSGWIAPRPRRVIPDHRKQEIQQSERLHRLCERLGYEWNQKA